jgi:DNA anti-recombination protein RmuC
MCSTVSTLSEQVPFLQQQLSQLSASLQQQQQQQSADGALPSWQGNMLAATQQVEDLSTAFASLEQQLTEASSTFNAGLAGIQEQQQQLERQLRQQREQHQLLLQQLQEQREEQQRLLQKQQEQQQMLTQVREQLQQQQQQQPQPTRFMVRAPVGMGGADLVATLAACGGSTPGSITTARIVWSPKPAAAEGSETLAAEGGGSGGSSSGSASGALRLLCL